VTSPSANPVPAKRFSWRLLLPPSVLIIVYLAVIRVTGPFFLSPNFDPDYVYLFNGLNIALGHAPVHTDHPGTPLQLLGGAWIRLHNVGASTGETAVNTILNSEDRLAQLNLLIFLLLLGAVTAAGFLIFGRTQKARPALLPAAGLLFLGTDVYCLGRYNPEPFLLLISFLLGLTIYCQCCLKQNPSPATATPIRSQSPLVFPLLASGLVATGLAAKINFAPLALLPLVLIRGKKNKLAYIFFTLVILALWLIPDYGQLGQMTDWWEGLATFTGRYGTGSLGLIDTSAYLRNAVEMAVNNLPYFLLVIVSLIFALHSLYRARKTVGANDSQTVLANPAGILLAVSACELLQFLIASKFQLSRYLVPGLGLTGLNLLLLLGSHDFEYTHRWLKAVVTVLGLASAAMAVGGLVKLNQRTSENLKVYNAGQDFPGQPRRVFGYGSSSPYYAWHFGNNFSGWTYAPVLNLLVPDSDRVFFYDNFLKHYENVRGQGVPRDYLLARGPVIFQSPPLGGDEAIYQWPIGVKLTEQLGGPYEKIYRMEAESPRTATARP